jgi:transposase
MLVTDGNGLPLGFIVASAQEAEISLAEETLADVRVPQRRGRPKTRPKEVVADKAYDKWLFRVKLKWRGIHPCIPERSGKKPRPGPKFNLVGYRFRWHIERTFAWLHNWRRLATRWDRKATIYEAFVLLACILITLKRVLR